MKNLTIAQKLLFPTRGQHPPAGPARTPMVES